MSASSNLFGLARILCSSCRLKSLHLLNVERSLYGTWSSRLFLSSFISRTPASSLKSHGKLCSVNVSHSSLIATFQTRLLHTKSAPESAARTQEKHADEDYSIAEPAGSLVTHTGTSLIESVNESLASETLSRLFAVIFLQGKQFKVTTADLLVVEGFFPPTIGDKIRLEKVLMVGGSDFTLVGKPLLDKDLVRVHATVVEKTLSQKRAMYYYRRRKGYSKFRLKQVPHTMVLINSIEVAAMDSNATETSPESLTS